MEEIEIRAINRQFLKAAIKKQFMLCITNERYRTGLFTGSINTFLIKEIILEILDDLHITIIPTNFRISQSEIVVLFNNGSKFQKVNATDGSRGFRFNDIIVDSDIDTNIYYSICLPRLIPYYVDVNNFLTDKTKLESHVIVCDIK